MSNLRVFSLLLFILIINSNSQNYDYRDAEKLFGEEKYKEAGEVFLQLAENNPYQGYFWSNYAYCLYMQKDYTNSIEFYKRAIEAGYRVPETMYNIACSYSLINDAANTVKWLRLSAENKYRNLESAVLNDKDFDPVRNSETFTAYITLPGNKNTDRNEGWKSDLRYMKRRMEQTHYDLHRVVSKDKWNSMFEELEDNVQDLNDQKILCELLKITASVGDGHTTIYPGQNSPVKLNSLPLQFFLFEEGLYITSVSPEYKELAGKKVIKIGNVSVEAALEKLKTIISTDNDIWYRTKGPLYMTYNSILYGLGITQKENETELTLEGNEKVTVKAVQIQEGHHGQSDTEWIKARDTSNQALCFKNPVELFWYEYLPEKKMVYMQLNGIGNKNDEKLSEFSKRVFSFINSNETEFFVLDIRYNSGGNNFLNKALVHEIIKCEKINSKGKFFAIIGRNTFSAAMNLANDLERQTNVIFAGEPTGSKPNFVGETNMIDLPYSGLRVSCSSRYWQGVLSDDQRKWIAPNLGVKYFYSDHSKGIDPALNAIIEFISK